MRIISRNEAEEILSKLDSFVIKKTVGTNSGKDVEIYKNGCESPKETIKNFGKDFVVQEIIHQCEQLSAINSSSVNTFRVITCICDDEIHTCPTVLRMGRVGKDKDNMHYGGICVGINPDGSLKKTAFAEYGERFDAHPDSNLVFNGYRIPKAGDYLWEKAKELHSLVPCMGIISWDLTIDDSERITIIEMNTTGQSTWFNQFANGESLFGKDTAKMLQLIRDN